MDGWFAGWLPPSNPATHNINEILELPSLTSGSLQSVGAIMSHALLFFLSPKRLEQVRFVGHLFVICFMICFYLFWNVGWPMTSSGRPPHPATHSPAHPRTHPTLPPASHPWVGGWLAGWLGVVGGWAKRWATQLSKMNSHIENT